MNYTMNTSRTKLCGVAALGTLLLGLMFGASSPAQVASDPAGFCQLTLLGNSDTILSLPFARPKAAWGGVSSASGSTVQALGAPNWTVNQFVYAAGTQPNTYYLRFDSGAKAGFYYPITANASSTLTVNLGRDSLAAVAQNDIFSVVPYWTLATIFPGGSGVFASPTPGDHYTEILVPSYSGSGINLSASSTYYFQGGFWKEVGQGPANMNNQTFPPYSYIIVRHNVATSSVLTTMGAVVVPTAALPLTALTTGQQDNFLALPRPFPISLDDSGLISSGAFASSPTPGNRTDELLTFDNTATGQNKSASATYFYWNGGWRCVGSGATIVGANQVFLPGAGVVIRKGANNNSSLWMNSTSY